MTSNYAIYENGSPELDTKVIEHLTNLAEKSIKEHSVFVIGLSGGSLATFLGRLKFAERAQLSKWHVFLADERAVPLIHADSNYRTIREAWKDGVGCQWHPVEFENMTLEESAKRYQEEIKSVFDRFKVESFDLILLGLGPDGHTASLFPSHPDFLNNLERSDRTVIPVENSPKPPAMRVSLSPFAIKSAKSAAFIVTGSAGKADVIRSIVIDRDPQYPPSLVCPNAFWFLDETTASHLKQ